MVLLCDVFVLIYLSIDKLLKNGNATPTAAASRLSYVDMLEGLKKVEKYLLNNQLMNTTRSTSEFDKLSKQNNKILKEISKHFAGENAWTVIKDYQEEYED